VQVIHPDWLIPIQCDKLSDNKPWLEDHVVVIDQHRICDLLDADSARRKYADAKWLRLAGHALLPGFINTHCHAAMNLLRGLSDDLPLKQWLEEAIWPVESKFVDDDFVYQGTEFAIAEMLRSGTTCFQDMYFMPDKAAEAVQNTGIRASIGLVVIDFATAWAKNAQEHLSKGLAVYDKYKHLPRLRFNLAPHAPYTVSTDTLEKILTYSHELNLNVQMHIHETAFEVETYFKQQGKRPLSALYEMGMLGPHLNAIHMTQLNEGEMEWLAETGTHVVHCPQSNMKLASGVCLIGLLDKHGVNIAIGTDGAASNNDLDMLGEMQSAALLAKVDSLDPTSMNAIKTLRSATLGGARALGLQDQIGSLEIGKQADMIAIDLHQIETMPVYNPVSQIVYSAGRRQVAHVWVAGDRLLENGKLTTMDEEKLCHQAAQWATKISAR